MGGATGRRGPEPGLSRPCPSDSSMEALTLNLTEVVKRQNPKSKKGFNQVKTPPSPPSYLPETLARVGACVRACAGAGGEERRAGGAVWGAHAVGCPTGGCVCVQRLWRAAGGALGARRTAPCRGPGASQWGRGNFSWEPLFLPDSGRVEAGEEAGPHGGCRTLAGAGRQSRRAAAGVA